MQSWTKKFFKAGDEARIEEAIAKAEALTTGEIIPMVVRKSSAIGHVAPMAFLLFVLLLEFSLLIGQLPIPPQWSVFAVLAFLPVAIWASRFKLVQRWLTSAADRSLQVSNRAELEFDRLRVRDTAKQTGILIFVSLMEQEARVLGDKKIAEKIPPEAWQAIVDALILGIKAKQVGEGFEKAIELSGKLLAQHFPVAPGDQNELADHLIVKE